MKVNRKRLRWQCRRGMRELDVVLLAFMEHAFDALDADAQRLFEQLLTRQDTELYAWITERDQPADGALAALVVQINECYRQTLAGP